MNAIQKQRLTDLNIYHKFFKAGKRNDEPYLNCIYWEVWNPIRIVLIVLADGELIGQDEDSDDFKSISDERFKFLYKKYLKLKVFE